MHHPPPLEDCIIVYCKGRCNNFRTIPFSELRFLLRAFGYASLTEFRNAYVCLQCESRFIVLVENLPAQPGNGNGEEDITF
jgi:hypothetical protein